MTLRYGIWTSITWPLSVGRMCPVRLLSFSREPSISDVTSIAKTCINESVEPDGRKYSERDSYGKKYYYPMVDDHGIEFNVIAENEKVTIAEAYIPFLYSKNLFYTTDYKERIMAYYTSEVEDILKEAGIADYIFQKIGLK